MALMREEQVRNFRQFYETSIDRNLDLPQVSIPYLKQLRSAKVSQTLPDARPKPTTSSPSFENPRATTPSRVRRTGNDSMDDPEADPWASPAMHQGHTHPVSNDVTPRPNGITAARIISNGHMGTSRTTSTFTTQSEEPGPSASMSGETPSGDVPSGTSGGGWGAYDNSSGGFPNGEDSGLDPSGFGSGGDGGGASGPRPGKSLGGGKTSSRGVEETVTITVLPEKEGMFMFQHRNYEVKSARRASTVIRRYSDFVWLLDCLHKRYPFRQLPLLPPKRVAGTSCIPCFGRLPADLYYS